MINHFIMKNFAEKFKKSLPCLGENIEKHITFAVPIENKNFKMLHKLMKMEKKLQKFILNIKIY